MKPILAVAVMSTLAFGQAPVARIKIDTDRRSGEVDKLLSATSPSTWAA
jgi:hypothetical protein